MASSIDTSKAQKALANAAKDPALQAIAVAAFKHPLTSGLRQQFEASQSSWAPLSPLYQAWKRAKGYASKIWQMTGGTLKAISQNAPSKLGTKKGMKTGINKRNSVAFAMPRTFTDRNGKKLSATEQEKVFNALRRGSAKARLASHAKKKGRSLKDVLSEAFGPKASARAVPGRPLFEWDRSWDGAITKDVEDAVVEVLKKEGLDAHG